MKFLIKLLEFLQEPSGEMSSRRLIMIIGSLLTIPVALVFGWLHPSQFTQILDALLIYLGTMGGLTLASRFAKNQNEGKK